MARLGGRGQIACLGAVAEEGFLDAPGVGGSDALVDGECLPQAGGAFAGVAVPDVAAADAFQGACFFQGRADVARDGQCLAVVFAGLLAGRVITWQLAGDQPKDLRLTWGIDPAARTALEEESFGKYVLISSHDDWPAPEVIAGYRSQSEAEFSFRQMKDTHVVSFSPMHHWTEHNIRVHVFTCVLVLQIAHFMRLKARRAGLRLSVRDLLGQIAGIGETVLIYPLRRRPAQSPPYDHRTHRRPAGTI